MKMASAAIAFVLAACLAALSACGDGEKEATPTATVTQPATATPEPTATVTQPATATPEPTATVTQPATATPEPTAEPTSEPPEQPPPAPATSTVLGLPIIPGHTYVGSTSEGYPVAFWLSADGQKLEPYEEAGEPVTVSFLIQVSRPEGCPWSKVVGWTDHIPPADEAIEAAVKALNDPTTLTYGTVEEMPISDGRFEKSGDIVLSGSVQGGLASGQFGGSVTLSSETCVFEPVTWSASLR